MKDYMSENSVGFCKVTCQRYDVNLTRIHLLLDVFEHNSNLSGPVFYWREWQAEFIHWESWPNSQGC